MAALRNHAEKQTKRIVPICAARTIQPGGIVKSRRAIAAASFSPTGPAMVFLDLYGTPCAPARTSSLPKAVQALLETVLERQQARERHVRRRSEALQLRWPGIRNIRAHS
jgi:hypothetical protein